MKKSKKVYHLRALLDQRFSNGPGNVLVAMRRSQVAPRAPRESGGLLDGFLQKSVQGLAKDNMSSFLKQQGLDKEGIDRMVAASLAQGPQTSGVLRSLFGIVPNLIGR